MAASCSTRASEIFSQAPAYAPRARASLSSAVGAVDCTAAAEAAACRAIACGRVLCWGAGAATGSGVGRAVPLRLAAAKLVMPWPMVVPNSVRDSWIWVG